MKKTHTFLFLILLLAFSACHDTTETNPDKNMTAEEKEMRSAIQQFPDSTVLKENLIQYLRESSRFEEAVAETDKILKKDSLNARWWDIKAILHYENEDTLKAITAYEKALDLDANPEYVIALGSLYAQVKNPKSLEMADGLLLSPKTGAQKEAYFIKGLYFKNIGDPEKAISFFNTCLAMDYNDLFSYREKTICLYNQGKYQEALEVMGKAVTIKPDFDEAYFWMGKCYEKTGDKNDAIENYQMALKIDPDYLEAKDALAKLGVN